MYIGLHHRKNIVNFLVEIKYFFLIPEKNSKYPSNLPAKVCSQASFFRLGSAFLDRFCCGSGSFYTASLTLSSECRLLEIVQKFQANNFVIKSIFGYKNSLNKPKTWSEQQQRVTDNFRLTISFVSEILSNVNTDSYHTTFVFRIMFL